MPIDLIVTCQYSRLEVLTVVDENGSRSWLIEMETGVLGIGDGDGDGVGVGEGVGAGDGRGAGAGVGVGVGEQSPLLHVRVRVQH